jgi:RHS repeat-associated protein
LGRIAAAWNSKLTSKQAYSRSYEHFFVTNYSKHDILGNRIQKSVGLTSPTITKYAYDENGNAWADLDNSGSLKTRRLYNDAVDSLLAKIDSSGNTTWYLTDILGSVRDLANGSGAPVGHREYDPFGKTTSDTFPPNSDRYGWTGRERDAELDLQYNRARYYDANTGRFLSQDPAGFGAGDPNLYRFVGNNPANATDPTGLFWSHLFEIGDGYLEGAIRGTDFVRDAWGSLIADPWEQGQQRGFVAGAQRFGYNAVGVIPILGRVVRGVEEGCNARDRGDSWGWSIWQAVGRHTPILSSAWMGYEAWDGRHIGGAQDGMQMTRYEQGRHSTGACLDLVFSLLEVEIGARGARAVIGRRPAQAAEAQPAQPAAVAAEEAARRRRLGNDPARGGAHNPLEEQCAVRLEERLGQQVERDPTGAADWIDEQGRTYNGVGPVPQGRFNHNSFVDAIERHLGHQGLDHVVVDLTNLRNVEKAGVRNHIQNNLTPAQRSRIIVLGS